MRQTKIAKQWDIPDISSKSAYRNGEMPPSSANQHSVVKPHLYCFLYELFFCLPDTLFPHEQNSFIPPWHQSFTEYLLSLGILFSLHPSRSSSGYPLFHPPVHTLTHTLSVVSFILFMYPKWKCLLLHNAYLFTLTYLCLFTFPPFLQNR